MVSTSKCVVLGPCLPTIGGRLRNIQEGHPTVRVPQGAGGTGGAITFWDSSAIVPLTVAEPGSEAVTRLAKASPGMVVWWATRVAILPVEDVRIEAARLLRLHALRAADSLQLAAALTRASRRPAGRGFVTLDSRLTAAAREGFELLLRGP